MKTDRKKQTNVLYRYRETDNVVYRQRQCCVQTESVMYRQRDRQCCVHTELHTVLCTARQTDNAVCRQTDRQCYAQLDMQTDSVVYRRSDGRVDVVHVYRLLMMYRRANIHVHQTLLSNTDCMTDNVFIFTERDTNKLRLCTEREADKAQTMIFNLVAEITDGEENVSINVRYWSLTHTPSLASMAFCQLFQKIGIPMAQLVSIKPIVAKQKEFTS